MRHVHSICHTRGLVQVTRIGPEVWVIYQPFAIAFEMQVIDRIKPHQCGEQPPIGLCLRVAHHITMGREPVFVPVQRVKQRHNGGVIGALRGGKTAFVDTVVYVAVDALVDLFDGVTVTGWPEIGCVAGDVVKRAVEHADDFRAFVGHDGVLLLVP